MLRRYRLPALLFSLCLSGILLFQGVAQPFQSSQQPSFPASQEVASLSLNENVRQTILENGLTVLTKEAHAAPAVSLQVWYNFGSQDQAPEVRGVAHLLEHIMFQGTKDRPVQFGRLLTALGGDFNAFTILDHTVYSDSAERDNLKALLILEADRMQNALIDDSDLAKEKQVLIAELKEDESNPRYRLSQAVREALFPNHPYGSAHWETQADIEKLTAAQVRSYYRQNYRPDNAVLVIVGDFSTEETLKDVRETFGKIPKGEGMTSRQELKIGSAFPPKTPGTSTPIVVRGSGTLPFLQVVYPLPALTHPDVPALDIMDYILTVGQNSRLSDALAALIKLKWAIDVDGDTINLGAGGWYTLSALASSSEHLSTIEQVLKQVISDFQAKGVTAEEVNRAKTQIKTGLILSNRKLDNQAWQLGLFQTVTGDYRYLDRYLAALDQVSPADVQRVAKEYLQPERRVVGFFEPTSQTSSAKRATAPSSSPTPEDFSPKQPVLPSEVFKYLPAVREDTARTPQPLPQAFKLSNGLQVLLLPDSSTPSVSLRGYVAAGGIFEPPNKTGLASLTVYNLLSGTKSKDALTLAQSLENRGASLKFSADDEGVNITGVSLARDLPIMLTTLGDVLQNSTFPTQGIELFRQVWLTLVQGFRENPLAALMQKFVQTIYPENHPSHRFPSEETIKAIRRDDVLEFYRQYYRPDTTVLALVGDFNPVQVRSQVETLFGKWQGTGKPPAVKFPPAPLPEKAVRLKQVIAGEEKGASITVMGYPSINRQDPRIYGAEVLNQILGGGMLSSRLESEIRDRLGLTYEIGSSFDTEYFTGTFRILFSTIPQNSDRAIAKTVAILKQIKEQGVTPEEVAIAKRSLASNYRLALTDPDVLTSVILSNQVSGFSLEELRQFPLKIEAVTWEQVNQIAKELLHPDRLVILTIELR
jgi:zinc protease